MGGNVKKQKKRIQFKNFLCIITIIIMASQLWLNKLPFIKPIIANAEQIPVTKDVVLYKEADLFDYNRWDWNLANYYDAWFYIQVEQSKYPLTLAVDDNNNVYLADKESGAKNQMWHLHYNSDCNAFVIENMGNNRILYQTGFDVGDNINCEDLDNSNIVESNANWKITSNKDNTFCIAAMKNTDLVLDAKSSDLSDPKENANIRLWTDTKTNNQKWNFIPVDLSTFDKALLYKPFQASDIGEANYNNVNLTTQIVKDKLSSDDEIPDFNSPISNLFSFFYNSDYNKYSDTGTYNGHADYGGLKPYDGVALRNYGMPYIINSNGWYEFDSSKYYVVKDDRQKKLIPYSRNIKENIQRVVSDGKENEGFFPFNGQGITEANYGFGMRTKLDFTYVDDGYVKYIDFYDENNPIKSQAMEFKFSGDDDLWVFVDGKLVLDVGGIHGRIEGSINFATKKSYVDGIEQNDFHSYFDSSKQNHTLHIFYLERCPYESNLKITFNLLMERQVTYHSNDGTDNIFKQTFINEPQIYIKENMFKEREGYLFKGWNTQADGKGTFKKPNTALLIQKDMEYFAQWEKKQDIVYTIALDGNGGVLKTVADNNQDIEKNNKIYANYTKNSYHIYTYDSYIEVHKNNIVEGTYKAIREGYTFQGFYTQKIGGRQIISSFGEILVDANTFAEDTILYAQWTPNTNTKYIVNHWIQDLGSDANLYNSTNYTLKETEELSGTTEALVIPEIKDYTGFTYAYGEGTNQEGVFAPEKVIIPIYGDKTTVIDYYYKRNYYRVGGYLPETTSYMPEIVKGNGIELTKGSGLYQYEEEVTVSAVCKQGYHWNVHDKTYPSSWYSMPDMPDVNKDNPIMTFTMPANDVYLKVDATNNRYKVIFDDNGGYFGPKEMELIYDIDSILPYPPTRFGFDFLRWTIGNKNYYVGQHVKNLTSVQNGQVIMTAQWKQKRFQLIKIASSMYGKTMVKRTIGDNQWYHSTGKWTLMNFYNIPKEQCVQRWNISDKGIITRVC